MSRSFPTLSALKAGDGMREWMTRAVARTIGFPKSPGQRRFTGAAFRRRGRSTKVLGRFKQWLDQEIQKVLPESPIGHAIQYTRGHWEGLLTYTMDGAVEIDTNRVERSIRAWKLSLKNGLFLGSEDGGHWGAVMFSLIESCNLHRINPEAYLKDVLVRISTTPRSQIENLMPRCWRPSSLASPDSS